MYAPYLHIFLVIMATLSHDIQSCDPYNLIPNRICFANCDEVVFVDDTICVSTSTKSMNLFLKYFEFEGAAYGLGVNKDKCDMLTMSLRADIRSADGRKVKRKSEETYLGCHVNQYSNITQEISRRVAKCMAIVKRLDIFWKHCEL